MRRTERKRRCTGFEGGAGGSVVRDASRRGFESNAECRKLPRRSELTAGWRATLVRLCSRNLPRSPTLAEGSVLAISVACFERSASSSWPTSSVISFSARGGISNGRGPSAGSSLHPNCMRVHAVYRVQGSSKARGAMLPEAQCSQRRGLWGTPGALTPVCESQLLADLGEDVQHGAGRKAVRSRSVRTHLARGGGRR